MVSLQVAIFVCIGIAMFVFSTLEGRHTLSSQSLISQIEIFDEIPSVHLEHLYMPNFPVTFDTLWVYEIIDALPETTSIARLIYIQSEFLLEGEVGDTALIEIYRQKLLEYFDYAWLGNILRLENGRYSYQLRIGVINEE